MCYVLCARTCANPPAYRISLSLSLARARDLSLYVCFLCLFCVSWLFGSRICTHVHVRVCLYVLQYIRRHMHATALLHTPPSSLPCTRRLEVGDVITEIEGEPVVHKSCEDVVRLLTGKEHSQVKLCCLRLQVS